MFPPTQPAGLAGAAGLAVVKAKADCTSDALEDLLIVNTSD